MSMWVKEYLPKNLKAGRPALQLLTTSSVVILDYIYNSWFKPYTRNIESDFFFIFTEG